MDNLTICVLWLISLSLSFVCGSYVGEWNLSNRLMRKIAQWAKEDAMVYVVPDEAE